MRGQPGQGQVTERLGGTLRVQADPSDLCLAKQHRSWRCRQQHGALAHLEVISGSGSRRFLLLRHPGR